MGKVCPTAVKAYDPCKGRPYNRYNIYYILEREKFLQSIPGYKSEKENTRGPDVVTGYEGLQDLPPLASRYAGLELPPDWYMPGKRKVLKRDHKKSHGVASFQEIAKVVADGWKAIDDETLEYCTAMAAVLKRRHKQLKRMGGLRPFVENLGRLPGAAPPATASSDPPVTESANPAAAANPRPAVVASLPKMADFVVQKLVCGPVASNPPLTVAAKPRPTVAASVPKMADFVVQELVCGPCENPPPPPTVSHPTVAVSMPKMADFVFQKKPPFAPPTVGSSGPSRRATVSSVAPLASDIFGGGVRAEGVPAPRRRLSTTSLSSLSTHSEVDIPDRDIMAMWFTGR